jgi:hypothetical protein
VVAYYTKVSRSFHSHFRKSHSAKDLANVELHHFAINGDIPGEDVTVGPTIFINRNDIVCIPTFLILVSGVD